MVNDSLIGPPSQAAPAALDGARRSERRATDASATPGRAVGATRSASGYPHPPSDQPPHGCRNEAADLLQSLDQKAQRLPVTAPVFVDELRASPQNQPVDDE